MNNNIVVNDYYDPDTGTFSYLLADTESKECIVIDPVLGFDMVAGRTSIEPSADIITAIEANEWQLTWILETHAHADHLTSAQQLKEKFNAKVAIGAGITEIQHNFKAIYQFSDAFDVQGNAFDRLLSDGDTIALGNHKIEVLVTPGHTSDSLTYRLYNYLFIGDTLFHPQIGSARCDFPGGDAGLLFQSIEKILAQGDECILCLCHDYPDDTRAPQTFIPVAEMRSENVHLVQANHNSDEFRKIREQRDHQLALPQLIVPSIQTNIQAGIELKQSNLALKWPINRF